MEIFKIFYLYRFIVWL